jgi:hypothetical protein
MVQYQEYKRLRIMQNRGTFTNNAGGNISRREFMGSAIAAAAAYGLSNATKLTAADNAGNFRSGKRKMPQRIAFDIWPNDTRIEPTTDSWPSLIFDEKTKDGIKRALDVQAAAGYNIVDLAGLLGGYSWPLDIKSASSKDKDEFFAEFIKLCHQRDMKFIFLVGVYSWGFDEIIKNDPEVRGPNPLYPNPHALCGSREKSWEWQKKVIDFLMQYGADGYHLESGDLHICSCDDCRKIAYCTDKWYGLIDYHCRVNKRSAEYIRSKKKDALLVSVMGNWCDAFTPYNFSDKDIADMVDLTKHIDCLYDQGHNQPYVMPPQRAEVIKKLGGKYGTSGGTWVYPQQNLARDQWFLPYTKRTGQAIKELYAMGGRGIMYYQGPVINPGVEANIDFGGRLMYDLDKDVNDVLSESLEHLYKPKKKDSLQKLADIFNRTEDGFYNSWKEELKKKPRGRPGEVFIAGGFSDERFLGKAGKGAYRRILMDVLNDLSAIENDFDDNGRIKRIQVCIGNEIKELEKAGYV